MAPLVLYHSPFSPFSRSVILLTRYLKLDVEVKVLDLMAKEQMEPEFLKINPQHCVPTIDDNGFYLWESRAIQSYLLEAKAPELLLTSPKEKAILNQRLQFELGGLTNKFVELIVSYHIKSLLCRILMLIEQTLGLVFHTYIVILASSLYRCLFRIERRQN